MSSRYQLEVYFNCLAIPIHSVILFPGGTLPNCKMFVILHYWNNERPVNRTALTSHTEEKVTAGALGNCLKFTGQGMCSQLDVSISSLVSTAMAPTQSYLLFRRQAGWKGASKECNASWFFFFLFRNAGLGWPVLTTFEEEPRVL